MSKKIIEKLVEQAFAANETVGLPPKQLAEAIAIQTVGFFFQALFGANAALNVIDDCLDKSSLTLDQFEELMNAGTAYMNGSADSE